MAQNEGYVSKKIMLQAEIQPDKPQIEQAITDALNTIKEMILGAAANFQVTLEGIRIDPDALKQSVLNSGLANTVQGELAKSASLQATKQAEQQIKKTASQTDDNGAAKGAKTGTNIPAIDGSKQSQDLSTLMSQMQELNVLIRDVTAAKKALADQPFSNTLKADLKDRASLLQDYIKKYEDAVTTGRAGFDTNQLSDDEQRLLAQAETRLNVAKSQLEHAKIADSDQVSNLNGQLNALKRINEATQRQEQLQKSIRKIENEDSRFTQLKNILAQPKQFQDAAKLEELKKTPKYDTYKTLTSALEDNRKLHAESEKEYNALKGSYNNIEHPYTAAKSVQKLLNEVQRAENTRNANLDNWDERTHKLQNYVQQYKDLNSQRQAYNKQLKLAESYAKNGEYPNSTSAMRRATQMQKELEQREKNLRNSVSRWAKGEPGGTLPTELESAQRDYKVLKRASLDQEAKVTAVTDPYVRNIQERIKLNDRLARLQNAQAKANSQLQNNLTDQQRAKAEKVVSDAEAKIGVAEKSLTRLEQNAQKLTVPTNYPVQELKDKLAEAEARRVSGATRNDSRLREASSISQALKDEIQARKDYNSLLDQTTKHPIDTAQYDAEIQKLNNLKDARDNAYKALTQRVNDFKGAANGQNDIGLSEQTLRNFEKLKSLTTNSAIKESNTSPLANNLGLQLDKYKELLSAQEQYLALKKQIDNTKSGTQLRTDLEDKANLYKSQADAAQTAIDDLKALQSGLAGDVTNRLVQDRLKAIQDADAKSLINDTRIQQGNVDVKSLEQNYASLMQRISQFRKDASEVGRLNPNDSGFNQRYQNLLTEQTAIEQLIKDYAKLASGDQAMPASALNKFTQLDTMARDRLGVVQNESIKKIQDQSDPRVLNVNQQIDALNQLNKAAGDLENTYAQLRSGKYFESDKSTLTTIASDLEQRIETYKTQLETLQKAEQQWANTSGNNLLTTQLAARDKLQEKVTPKVDATSQNHKLMNDTSSAYQRATDAAINYSKALQDLSVASKMGLETGKLMDAVTQSRGIFEAATADVKKYEEALGRAKLSSPALDSQRAKFLSAEANALTTQLKVDDSYFTKKDQALNYINEIKGQLSTLESVSKFFNNSTTQATPGLSQMRTEFMQVYSATEQCIGALNQFAEARKNLFLNNNDLNSELLQIRGWWSQIENSAYTGPFAYDDKDIVPKLGNMQRITELTDKMVRLQKVGSAMGTEDTALFNSLLQERDSILSNFGSDLETQINQIAGYINHSNPYVAKEAQKSLNSLKSQIDNDNAWTKTNETLARQYDSLYMQATKFSENNSSIKNTMSGMRLDALKNQINEATSTRSFDATKLQGLRTEFASIQRSAMEAGIATKTFGDKIFEAGQKFVSWFGVSQLIMSMVTQFRNLVEQVKAVDSSMVELRKVTDLSEAGYAQYMKDASQMSKDIGVSLTDVIDSTAEFARLGNTVDTSKQLAEAALVFKSVGDGISSASDASEKIIAISTAFNVPMEKSMSIVDKLNEVGKQLPKCA